jgi:hypothetical protein
LDEALQLVEEGYEGVEQGGDADAMQAHQRARFLTDDERTVKHDMTCSEAMRLCRALREGPFPPLISYEGRLYRVVRGSLSDTFGEKKDKDRFVATEVLTRMGTNVLLQLQDGVMNLAIRKV